MLFRVTVQAINEDTKQEIPFYGATMHVSEDNLLIRENIKFLLNTALTNAHRNRKLENA